VSVHVKPGQVWQHKNMGSRWEVLHLPEMDNGKKWWPLQRVEMSGSKTVPEWLLLDDYVLVKEAP